MLTIVVAKAIATVSVVAAVAAAAAAMLLLFVLVLELFALGAALGDFGEDRCVDQQCCKDECEKELHCGTCGW